MNFNLPKEDSSIIKVIGVGGGGSNAVNHMYKQGIRGVDFIICNTDQQALDTSPVPKKIALGSSLTQGLGAGAQAEKGRNAAIENLDEIREVLEHNTKMVFITAGMGGGTGTGAAPVIAEVARELGILTVGIVTIPFTFEGRKRKIQAEKGLEELKKHVDSVLVISNDKLRQMYGNLTLREAFDKADDVLSIGAKGIAEIITVEGYVNVDFEDVRTVMTNSGVAIMGSATTSGEDRATKAVELALSSPLLNDNNIYGASNILLYINSGKKEVTMDEVAAITDYIQEEAGLDADVIWGNGMNEDLDDKLSLTIIATGFSGEKRLKIEGNEGVKKLDLYTKNNANPAIAEEPKTPLPAGLTTRPILFNKELKPTTSLEKLPINAEQSNTNTQEPAATEKTSEEPIIKHSLEEVRPDFLAYKVDEKDTELNAKIEEDAPETIGTPIGKELPTFSYNEEEDERETDTNIVAETPTTETQETPPSIKSGPTATYFWNEQPTISAGKTEHTTPETPKEETSFTENAATNVSPENEKISETENAQPKTELRFGLPAEQTEPEEKETDNFITTEKSTEVVFDLNNDTGSTSFSDSNAEPNASETESKENITLFNLNDDTIETSNKKEEEPTAEEPTLAKRQVPLHNEIDAEEMQRKQSERFAQLKARMTRFRSPTNLAELENTPAYKRRETGMKDVPHSSESSITNLRVEDSEQKDENGNRKGGLSNGNSFLHESVD